MKIRPEKAELSHAGATDWQTDMTKLIDAFHNFTNARKKTSYTFSCLFPCAEILRSSSWCLIDGSNFQTVSRSTSTAPVQTFTFSASTKLSTLYHFRGDNRESWRLDISYENYHGLLYALRVQWSHIYLYKRHPSKMFLRNGRTEMT
jgi:hypothetical protein